MSKVLAENLANANVSIISTKTGISLETPEDVLKKFFYIDGPHALLLGPTFAGKTYLLNLLACALAAKKYCKGIGKNGCSTIKARKLTFTNNPFFKDKVVIFVEKDAFFYSILDLQKLLESIITKVALYLRRTKKITSSEDLQPQVSKLLVDELGSLENTEASILLLDPAINPDIDPTVFESVKDCIINQILNIPFSILQGFYSLAETTGKINKTHDELVALITENVSSYLKTTEIMNNVYKLIHNGLSDVFNKYFTRLDDNQNTYFHISPLDSETTFDKFFFRNNDLSTNSLSLELLCDNIKIISYLREPVIRMIDSLPPEHRDALKNIYGFYTLTITDTKGVLHENQSQVKEIREVKNLILSTKDIDLIVFLVPMVSGKALAFSQKLLNIILRECKKDARLILLRNQADIYISGLKNNHTVTDDDVFNDEFIVQDNDIDVHAAINDRCFALDDEIIVPTDGRIKFNSSTDSRGCTLVRTSDSILDHDFGITATLSFLLKKLSESRMSQSQKFIFTLDNSVASHIGIEPKIDTQRLTSALTSLLSSKPALNTRIFNACLNNINKYRYITPHLSCWKAAILRLKWGYGYNGSIDESWFVNVHSFILDFPNTLANAFSQDASLITDKDLYNLIDSCFEFEGGHFASTKDESLAFSKIASYIDPRDIISYLLYTELGSKSGFHFNTFLEETKQTILQLQLTSSNPYLDKAFHHAILLAAYRLINSDLKLN